MAITDYKVLQAEVRRLGIQGVSGERLTGTVEENKARFDMLQELIVEKFNLLVDYLASTGDVDSIAGRVTNTETEVANLDGRMDTAETDIDALAGRMNTAEGNITSHGNRITTEEGKTAALEAYTRQIDGRLSDAETELLGFENDMRTGRYDFTGSTISAAGTGGTVPAPQTTDVGKFLSARGTWEVPSTNIVVEGLEARISSLETWRTDAEPSLEQAEMDITDLLVAQQDLVITQTTDELFAAWNV